MKPLVQLSIKVRKDRQKPTRDEIEQWAKVWVRTGLTPEGVEITPIVWNNARKSCVEMRRWMLRNKCVIFGNPGIVRYYHDPETLLIDYDHDYPFSIMEISRVIPRLNLKVRGLEYARTRRGWHLTIFLNSKVAPAVTIALQAILGSDPARETFNLARVLSGKTDLKQWNILFEEKL